MEKANQIDPSPTTRTIVLRVTLALLCNIFCSLIILGYQALQPILEGAGIYAELCGKEPTPCTEQELRLKLMFTLSTSVLNTFLLLAALLIPCIGTAWTTWLGLAGMAAGGIIASFSTDSSNAMFIAYMLWSISSACSALPFYSLASLSRKHSGLIFSLMVASLDASAVVFFLMYLLYTYLAVSLRALFLGYTVIPILCFLLTPYLLGENPLSSCRRCGRGKNADQPGSRMLDDKLLKDSSSGAWANEDVDKPRGLPVEGVDEGKGAQAQRLGEDLPLLRAEDNMAAVVTSEKEKVDTHAKVEGEPAQSGPPAPFFPLRHNNVCGFLIDPMFWVLVPVMGVYLSSKYFYVMNVSSIVEWASGGVADAATKTAVEVFSILLPLAGLSTPITSRLLDKYGTFASLLVLGAISLAIALLSIHPALWAQYVVMVLVVFNRFLGFVIFPSVLVEMFGPLGGTVGFGLLAFLGSTVNYLNYAWVYISVRVLSRNFMPVLVALNAVAATMAGMLALCLRRWKRKSAQQRTCSTSPSY